MTNNISVILKQMSQQMYNEEEKCAASQRLNPGDPKTPLRSFPHARIRTLRSPRPQADGKRPLRRKPQLLGSGREVGRAFVGYSEAAYFHKWTRKGHSWVTSQTQI